MIKFYHIYLFIIVNKFNYLIYGVEMVLNIFMNIKIVGIIVLDKIPYILKEIKFHLDSLFFHFKLFCLLWRFIYKNEYE